MPFLNDAVPLPLSPEPAPPQPFHQLLGTAFTRENIVGSAIEAYQQPPAAPPDPSYDPFSDIGGYENDASAFISANNDEDVARVKMRINDERRREQELRDGGARGMVAALAAGVLDPTILLPVGGQVYAATRAGRASLGALRVGAATGAATAVQETGLQLTQETRDLSESLINVGGATFLGGVLGGAVGALRRPLTREFADQGMREAGIFERELAGNAAGVRAPDAGQSIGAAAVRDTTLEQETFAGALGAERALARTAPNTRVGTSRSLEVRQIGEDLVDQPLLTKKNAEGIVTPQSVETRMQLWEGPLATALDDIEDAFVRYRLGRDPKMLDVARLAVGDLFGRGGGKMSYEEFAAEVTRAGRREDKSAIPEVAQAVAAARGKVIDPGKEKAIAAGLLDKDVSVSTAPSYMMRIYDTVKIVAKRGEFSARITGWLGREQGKKHAIRTQVADLLDERKDLSTKVNGRLSQIDRQTRAEQQIEIRAQEVSRLNAFAFKRSSARTKSVDELRASIAATHTKVAPQLERLAKLSSGIRGEKELLPGLREIEASMFRLIGAGGKLKEGGELVDLIKGGEEFSKAIGELRATVRGGIAAKSQEGRLARQAPEATDLVALEKAQAEISKTIRPYRKELRRLQGELKREMRARSGPARGGAVFETEIRRRGNTLADQASGKAGAIDAIEARLGPNQARLAAIQTELERLVASWEGNTSRGAKSAIARRTEKEATRAPDAGRLKEADKPVFKAAKAIAKANTQLDEGDLKDVSRQIIDRILGTPVGRLPYDMEVPAPRGGPRADTAPPRGPLAARTFMIPDEEIEDFLENDIRRILHVYNRTMSADTELAVKFGRPDMEGQFQKVLQSYERLREGVTDERKLKQLDAAKNSDMRDLAGMRDRLRGTYALPDNPDGFANRAFHVVRNLNYMRLLGGMTLSALPDIARAPMVHGMTNVFRDGLVPLLTDFRQYRMSAVEANLAGAANEMVLDSRAMSMADMLNDYGRWSKYERGIQAMTSKFGLVTLMAPWNQAMKQFVAVVSQTRSLRAIEALAAGGNVAQAERARLAHLGLGEEMIGRIASEFETHGEKGRTWWANTAAWTDHEAADHFRAALVKEVDMVIVTPGQELPFWSTGAYGNTGKLIGQFKGFSLSSAQRVMLSGLQKRDMATLNGAILMTGLGMASYAIRQQLNPKAQPLPDPSTPEGLARWLREGVDRAGLTGWMFEAHNIVEKASGGNIGLGAITGGPPMSRYASRSAAESIAGPTFGAGFNLATKVFNAATTPGDFSAAETSAFRQMIPYNTVFYWRRLFDEAEHGLNQALGVPEKQ